ncbi:MAG: glycosyltransferase [Rhodobacteraceae bacterium]|nr:glycosyltransferase [Paracoccaceae bacterium]
MARLRAKPPRDADKEAPLVTVLRPVRGLENNIEATLRSGLTLDYPRLEVLFCVAEADDPVVPLVRRLIAEHPRVEARLLVGNDPISANPKLNNLQKGWQAARAEWIVMADCNLLLPRDYIRQLRAAWRPGTGLVSSPAVGQQAVGLAGALECAFLNGYQARWQLAADQVGLGFAQGKTLFWRRDVLEAGGGLAALGKEMAEDVAATKLVRRQGLRVRLARLPFVQPVGARTLPWVWARQLRWARIRRHGFPALFVPELLTGAAAPLVAVWAAASGAGGSAASAVLAFGALWYGAEWALARAAGWPASARDLLAWVLRDLMIPALWLGAWRNAGIVWQGTAIPPPLRKV